MVEHRFGYYYYYYRYVYMSGVCSVDHLCHIAVTALSLYRLSLQCYEDGGLDFTYPGSVLLQDSEVSEHYLIIVLCVCHSYLCSYSCR